MKLLLLLPDIWMNLSRLNTLSRPSTESLEVQGGLAYHLQKNFISPYYISKKVIIIILFVLTSFRSGEEDTSLTTHWEKDSSLSWGGARSGGLVSPTCWPSPQGTAMMFICSSGSTQAFMLMYTWFKICMRFRHTQYTVSGDIHLASQLSQGQNLDG